MLNGPVMHAANVSDVNNLPPYLVYNDDMD